MKRGTIDIGALALLHTVQHVYLNALPPIYLLLRAEFNVSTFQIGLIGSVQGVISILQGPAGYLVERMGRKRLAVLSMLLCSAAVFLYSFAPSFEALLVLIGVFSLSQVPFHPSTYAMVIQRAPGSRRGKYVSYHQVGGFIGSAIGTAAIAGLASIYGWRATLQIIPLVGLTIIMAFWGLVKDPAPENEQPQIPEANNNPVKSKEEFRVTTSILILVFGISVFSLGNLLNYVPLFLSEAYGETVAWAGVLSSIMHAVGSASSIFGGVATDRFDKATIMAGSMIGSGIITILLAVGQFSPALLLLVLVLYGVTRYFPVPAQHTLSSIAASGHPQGIGFSYIGTAIGQIFSAPLIGYFIDAFGARSAFLVCSVIPFIAGGIVLVLRKGKTFNIAR
jgi:predicted MFS family arabinose efflux permease